MAYRFDPGQPISRSARAVGIEQIDAILSRLSQTDRGGTAVHESRKALKRLRALLHLIRPGMSKPAFRRDEARLKRIAHLLSGVRDIQAMLETVEKLDAAGAGPVGNALRARLEAERAAAERQLDGDAVIGARKLLVGARKAFSGLQLEKDDFTVVAQTLERDYRKARQGFRRAYEAGEDEIFHDWRKYVQRHWRQLLLVAPGWPKALRPHIALARDLSDVLGEDHDLYVLAARVRAEARRLGTRPAVNAYLKLCRERQAGLRRRAEPMGARLLAEKPSSLSARFAAYWRTAPLLAGPEESGKAARNGKTGNVIALKRSES